MVDAAARRGRRARARRRCTRTRVIGRPSDASSGTCGSCARTSAPSSTSRSAIAIDGDSRQSEVAGLYARPSSRIRDPLTARSCSFSSDADAADDVVGHVAVDVVGELDEAEALAESALDPPREVRRVDRQAVAADTRAGREAHVAERLRRGGVDRRPDVDAEVAREHRELVDERDVDVPERVLEQLHQLGFAGRSRRARPCRRARRRTPRPLRATRRRCRTRPSAC